jgi:hypothetical protein
VYHNPKLFNSGKNHRRNTKNPVKDRIIIPVMKKRWDVIHHPLS